MPKKQTKAERIINSDSFERLQEIIQIVAINYDQQIITLIKHLIHDSSGNAYQLSSWILSELKKGELQ